jgi:hypothetical protein
MTARDITHAETTHAELVAGSMDCPHCGGPCESDCYTSETIMTSIGYVEVWLDGAVVASGREVAQIDG